MRSIFARLDIRVCAAYGAVATLWIIFSDTLLSFLFSNNPGAITIFSTLKGLGFVILTTALLFIVLSAELRKRTRVEEALRRDLTERQRITAALKEAEEKYHSIFEAAYDMIVLSDRDGNILDVNQRAESILGYTRAELRSMNTFRDFYHADDVPLMRQVFKDLTEGRSREYEARIHTRDGRVVHFSGASSPRFDADGRFISSICAVRDNTERRHADEHIRALNRRLEILHDIDVGIIEAQSLQSLADSTVKHLRELTGCELAALALDNPTDAAWEPLALDASLPVPPNSAVNISVPANWASAFSERLTHVIPDLTQLGMLTEGQLRLAGAGMRSVLYALIMAQDGPIGTLLLSSTTPGFFSDEHEKVAGDVASQLTIAVRQWQMSDELVRHAAELEQKVAERTADLQVAKDRVETILNNSTDGIVLVQTDLHILRANPAFNAMFGYRADEAVGQSLLGCLDSAGQERLTAALAAGLAENAVKRLELGGCRQDGSRFDVRLSIGIAVGGSLVCTLSDITERLVRERELRFHASLQENVTDAVVAADMNFQIRSWNRAAERIYGWRADEVLGKHVNEIIPAEFPSGVDLHAVQENFVEQGYWTGEAVQHHRDGSVIHILGSTVLFKDDNGEPFGIVSVNHDITARKQAEIARRESEYLYRLLAENITDMVARYKDGGEFIYLSPSVQALLGFQPDELIGKSAYDYLHPDDIAHVTVWHENLLARHEASAPLTYRLRHKDGHYVWLEATAKAILSEETGELLEIVASSRDVTARKIAEEALQKALESEKELGELKTRFVSTASHEFRTPLATILALTETLSAYRHRMSEDQIDERFGKIKGQVEHLTAIMDDVLLLARMQARRVEFSPTRLNLEMLCRSVIDEFQSHEDVRHTLAFAVSGPVRDVQMDRKLMRQTITNLVSNAIKYSPPEMPVRIDLEYREQEIILRVRDEGIGIPEADLKHLFEPFHRAANVGEISGTGLGLVITKEYVELHGGRIDVDSRLNVGTTITIRIPAGLNGSATT